MEGFEILIIAAIFLVAVLYSSVGHGGGSGYLAVMAFFTVAPNVTKPTALALNIFVSAIATIQFYRRGHFSWRVFLPFAVTSIPLAFIGGTINLPIKYYKYLLGFVLLFAAFRLAWRFRGKEENSEETVKQYSLWLALIIGAIIGITSGLIGVGGGIFLTPILFLTDWTETRKAAGISAMFVLVNSISGLLGNYQNAVNLPSSVGIWIFVAVIGGIIGSTLGSKYFNSIALRRALAVVLLVAGVKLLLV
ncbi:MAG: sulfite exporter TauE/SafE family protein [Aridibacter sp.]